MARKSPKSTQKLATAAEMGDQVICHWFDTQQGRWRDDLTTEDYCINQLHGNPQTPAPAVSAADIPESFTR